MVWCVLGGVSVYFLNNTTTSVVDYSDIEFISGEYHNKIWNENSNQNVPDAEFVPDIETAVQIASVIFSNKQKQGFFKEYELQQFFYDENDKVWIISGRRDFNGLEWRIKINCRLMPTVYF